jgi:hypothetical protein
MYPIANSRLKQEALLAKNPEKLLKLFPKLLMKIATFFDFFYH